ncbi:MAG TPA: hypothetical protein VHS06_11625 [Chloroflexota bacterium]|nr:hypothetical protein [Chloroflexota bacterium]
MSVLASTACPAAIGVFRWYATPDGATAGISYYLNLAGDSGRIEICPDQSGSPGSPIRTIALTPTDLSPGSHTVTWDGNEDDGSPAPAGSCLARIYVHAAPIPSPTNPNDPLQMPQNRKMLTTPSGNFYGVAADCSPESNHQLMPSSSSYGFIYAPNTLSKKMDVYYPDGVYKNSWSTALSGTKAPWGVSVDGEGRVYSASQNSWVVYNFASDGSNMLGGNICGVLYGGGAAWGKAADGTARFQTVVSNKLTEWRILPEAVMLNPPDTTKWTNFDSTGKIEVLLPMTGCTQTARDTVNGFLYVTQYNATSQVSLRRFQWTGSGYTIDDTWLPEVGSNVCGVAVCAVDPNILFVTRQSGVTNLERWYVEHPSPSISGPALLDAYKVADIVVHNVASDSRGNALFDAGGSDRNSVQRSIGMFIFPDGGSEDTRLAGPFYHDGPANTLALEHVRDVATVPAGSSVSLEGKIVSAKFGSVLYVQEEDRSAGVRVEPASQVEAQPGTSVKVVGTVDCSLGERRITDAQVTPGITGEAPKPLMMGTRFADNDPSEQLEFVGLNNLGLLVRVAGRVTAVDSANSLFYVDDGQGLDNGFGSRGIAVSFSGMGPDVRQEDVVSATGISSCRKLVLSESRTINGHEANSGTTVYEPTILLRGVSDVFVIKRP